MRKFLGQGSNPSYSSDPRSLTRCTTRELLRLTVLCEISWMVTEEDGAGGELSEIGRYERERVCVCVCERERERERVGMEVGGQAPALHFPVLPPGVPCGRVLPGQQPVHTAGPGQAQACAPTCSGCTQRPFPRRVSLLFCPSARPPQSPISTVVLWKVSAPRSTLWPDVVIRKSYKRRQNTRREGGA